MLHQCPCGDIVRFISLLGRVLHCSGDRPRKGERHEELLRVEIVFAGLVHNPEQAARGGTAIRNVLVQPPHE